MPVFSPEPHSGTTTSPRTASPPGPYRRPAGHPRRLDEEAARRQVPLGLADAVLGHRQERAARLPYRRQDLAGAGRPGDRDALREGGGFHAARTSSRIPARTSSRVTRNAPGTRAPARTRNASAVRMQAVRPARTRNAPAVRKQAVRPALAVPKQVVRPGSERGRQRRHRLRLDGDQPGTVRDQAQRVQFGDGQRHAQQQRAVAHRDRQGFGQLSRRGPPTARTRTSSCRAGSTG